MNPLLLIAVLLSSFAANAAPSSRTDFLADGSDIYEHHFSILKSSIVTIRIWSPVTEANTWAGINDEARFGAGLTLYHRDHEDDDVNCKIACRFKINGRSYENTEKQDSDLQSNLEKKAGSHQFVLSPTRYKGVEQNLRDADIGFYDTVLIGRPGKWSVGCKPAPVPVPSALWLFASAISGMFLAKRTAAT